MDSAIEVRYAGVVVGRATQVKNWTATGAFIGFTEPLPTGTPIELRGENISQPARVDEVVESSDPSLAGMTVSFLYPSSSSSPSPPTPEPSPSAPSDRPAAHSGGGNKRKRRR